MRAKKPYHKRRPSKQQIELLCAEARPDDGVDPRYDKPVDRPRPPTRKALQLASQVQHALTHALNAAADPVLNDLEVVSVEPAPNSTRLLVTVRNAEEPELTVQALQRAAGMLRCEVGAAIHRKRTPELAFHVLK
jgi:ribosome-binding factor A